MRPRPEYDLKPVRAPRLRGTLLHLAVMLLERPVVRALIAPLLTSGLGLRELRAAVLDEPPTWLPIYPGASERSECYVNREPAPRQKPGDLTFQFRRIQDYEDAYRSGATNPEEVAERALSAIARSDESPQPLRAFIACQAEDVLAQARAATARWKAGCPLGLLDGVPIAVKDELDMTPYPTTAGTRFLGTRSTGRDATVVARLRSAGALLIGKTNMHEIGILPDGLNAHHGPVRNPYGPAHESGGSSSGSAAAVAAGLSAASIGADAGGSIRIPASYCGMVGLKPTFGRVSEFGAVPLAWTLAHIGPIAATAQDAAIIYRVISGPDARDPNTHFQPPVELRDFGGSLKGLRVGLYRDWFRDATENVVHACDTLLNEFVHLGAEIVEVAIPELRLIAVAHGLTIHSEMATNMERYDGEHRKHFSLTTRLMLANARALRSTDYVQAQRIRSRAIEHFRAVLAQADVIATPTTTRTAPEMSTYSQLDQESDIARVFETMRFINAANLTGLPAISIPAGYATSGLPIGLHLVGSPWEERTLFRFALAAESIVPRQRPVVWFDLLKPRDVPAVRNPDDSPKTGSHK